MIIGICGKAGSGKDTAADFLVKNHGFVKVAFADVLKRICKEVFDFSDEQLWGPSEKRNEPDKRYPRGSGIVAYPRTCESCGTNYENVPGKPATACCPKCGSNLWCKQGNRFGETYLTPRHALQQLGTEWGRNCYPNVWVDYALRVAQRLAEGGYAYDARRGLFPVSVVSNDWMKPKTDVVISDVRFKNEVDAIKKAGGEVWRIHRPVPARFVAGAGGTIETSSRSEWELSGGKASLDATSSAHVSETEQDTIPADSFLFTLVNDGTLEELEKFVGNCFEESRRILR